MLQLKTLKNRIDISKYAKFIGKDSKYVYNSLFWFNNIFL